MTAKTLMAGVGAFVAALVVVAVVFAVFTDGKQESRGKLPASESGETGKPAESGKALVDVDWKSRNSDTGKTGKQTAQNKTDRTEEPPRVDDELKTD